MPSVLSQMLLKEHSKVQALNIKDWIGNDPERFGELMAAFCSPNPRLCQRAAWVLSLTLEDYPDLVEPYHQALLKQLEHPTHNAVIRNTVRLWQWVPLPEELAGTIANKCMEYLNSPSLPIAVRAFSMGVLYRLGLRWPELMEELKLALQSLLPLEKSPGLLNRGNKILQGRFKPEVPYRSFDK